MEFAVELSPLEHEQPVSKFSREHVAFNLEAMDADLVSSPLGRNQILEEGQVVLEPIVLVLEGLDLRGKLTLRGLLDLQARLARIGNRAQPRGLALEPRHRFAQASELGLQLASVEAGKSAAGIVHPGSQGQRERQENKHAQPTPIPSDVSLNRHPGRRYSEALAELLEHLQHSILRRVRARPPDGRGP